MQVTSSGAAAAWDTPTIEPNLPPSVNAYDPGNPDNGGTLDSPPQQQDSSTSYYDTAEPQPLQQGPAPGFEILYTKPLLVDPATGEALEVLHTKPLQISLDGSGPVDYGVNKPLQIDGAPHFDIGYNKPLLIDPATGDALEVLHTKPLQIAPESAMQAASPDAAAAVAAPKASAMEIAALELLLAEPANQEMIAQFGPPLAPLNTGTDVGSGIQARFGADLGARLTQLQEAQNNVRGQFLKALDEAQQHPGPGVVGSEYIRKVESWRDGELTETSLYTVTYPASATQDSDLKAIDEQFKLGMHGRASTAWELTDLAEFAKAYAAGDSPAQKAFASLHGKEPLQFHEAVQHGDSDIGPDITPAYYSLGESKLVSGRQIVDENGNQGGWSESTLQKTQLTPEHNRRLINNEYLWFDPVNGWSTDLDNNIRPSSSFLDKAIPLVFAGGLTMITAGAFGITAASASSSLGQSMALGAISSASMQLTTGGKLDLGNILRSALTAGVTFGVTKFTELGNLLSSTDTATRTLGHLGKAGLQGLLQEATGGKFKDGLTNSLISSVAGEVGKSLDNHIAKLSEEGSLNVQEASTLRLMSRAASSAVRVAGSGDAAAGFASDFLGGLMEEANPFAGKAEAGGKTDKAGKPNKGENTSDTTPGEKPNNGWVQSLGASDVDPNQAQGLKPGSSLQGLRVSGDALSGWGDEIDGGTALNGSMAPEARTTGEAVVGKGQGPLAALAAAGLSAQEQQAAYGQLLASGQVRLNAQGVPMVQPGQVLRFDLSDTSAAQLGGRAIAAESGGRIARDLAAQRHHLDRNDAQLQQDIAQQFAAGVNSARLAAKPLAEQIPGGPARFTVASDRAQTEGIVGQLLDNLDRFNNSPLGMALQGLPPEGLAIGGIRAGLTWVGKADKVVDSLQAEGRLTGSVNNVGNVANTTVDAIEGTGRLGGTLYPPVKLGQLDGYLAKRGITLKVGDEHLPYGKAGGFDASRGELLLRSEPTNYEVWHELSHFRQYQMIGREKYLKLPRSIDFNAPEQFVFDMLENSPKRWNSLSYEQQRHAVDYIEWIGGIR